jgi:hypothetical protein
MITWIAAREWFPSWKQKPKEAHEVLGVIQFADDAPYIDIVTYDSRDKQWVNANGLDGVRVTYWCELPDLPRRRP